MYWELFVVPFVILVIIIFVKKVRNNLKTRYPDWMTDLIISIISIFIGALLAIKTTKFLDNSGEKEKYTSLLYASIKMDENYIVATKTIIDSISTKPESYFETFRSIKNVNNSFILMEIIKNGYLYKFSSDKFKSYLPKLIAKMQYNDLTIMKDNNNSLYKYKVLYRDLTFKKELLEIELKYINNNLNNDLKLL